MYCKGKKHAEHIFTRECSDLYIHMFFSFLALMVRAFIWCWSRLTWKIMSTWCRFSMLGQRHDAHFSICCTDRFRKLELFERYKTSVRTPRNFDHMCKAPARPDLYQLISAPSFNWKLMKVKNYWNPHKCDFFPQSHFSHFRKYFMNFIWQRGE